MVCTEEHTCSFLVFGFIYSGDKSGVYSRKKENRVNKVVDLKYAEGFMI